MWTGRMGQSVVRGEPSAAEIATLETEMNKLFEECERLKAAQPALEDQVRTLSAALQKMHSDKSKFEIDIKAITERLPQLRSQLKLQEKKAAESVSDPKQVKTTSINIYKKNIKY